MILASTKSVFVMALVAIATQPTRGDFPIRYLQGLDKHIAPTPCPSTPGNVDKQSKISQHSTSNKNSHFKQSRHSKHLNKNNPPAPCPPTPADEGKSSKQSKHSQHEKDNLKISNDSKDATSPCDKTNSNDLKDSTSCKNQGTSPCDKTNSNDLKDSTSCKNQGTSPCDNGQFAAVSNVLKDQPNSSSRQTTQMMYLHIILLTLALWTN